jgi:hypothetical protein
MLLIRMNEILYSVTNTALLLFQGPFCIKYFSMHNTFKNNLPNGKLKYLHNKSFALSCLNNYYTTFYMVENFPKSSPFSHQDELRIIITYIIVSHNYICNLKLHGHSPQANYTDQATAACRQS